MGTKYMPWDLWVERGADRGQKLGLIVARDTRSATVAHVKYSPEKKGERKTRRLPGGQRRRVGMERVLSRTSHAPEAQG
jgi:ABC-type thiamine transport system ATPase subunit